MKRLVVTRCSACPLFEDSQLKTLGGILTQALMLDVHHGICNLLPSGEYVAITDIKIGLPPGPERTAEGPRYEKAQARRVVPDKREVPDDCPLRQGDVTITIAGGN